MTDAGYVVAVDGLSVLRDLESIPADVKRAALQAVNRTVERTRTDSSRRIREQVAYPARYLDSREDGRLAITQRATGDNLEGRIAARFRPTSLARFSKGGAVGSRTGVNVEVAPGFSKLMRRAFLIRLRAGNAGIETRSNMGLAIRLKPGETIQNKRRMVPLKPGQNVYLLYGPSVSDVFRTVAADAAPDAAEFLEQEFMRLMDLDR